MQHQSIVRGSVSLVLFPPVSLNTVISGCVVPSEVLLPHTVYDSRKLLTNSKVILIHLLHASSTLNFIDVLFYSTPTAYKYYQPTQQFPAH